MEEQVVSLVIDEPGPGSDAAYERLVDALPDARVGRPEETGVFDVKMDAELREDALERVWNAIAAAGADDHIVFLEHPDIPEHWRTKSV